MELRHARYFLAVAEALNFTEAARRLHIAQPPLSQQIAALERELGARLFERHSRNVELTAAGRAFRRHAEAMLAQAARAETDVRAVASGRTGSLHVAATSSVLFSGLAARISAFRLSFPDVEIVIHELPPQEQADRLLARRVDVSFLRFAPEAHDFDVVRAWDERAVVIAPPRHRLAARKSVRLQALKEEEFVFYRLSESAFAQQIHALCVEQGFTPHIVQEVAEAFTVMSLVAAGLGIGIVPEAVAGQGLVASLAIDPPSPSAAVHALTRKDASPLARRFVTFATAPESGRK